MHWNNHRSCWFDSKSGKRIFVLRPLPERNPEPCELPPIIEETVALYREGHPNIKFEISNTSDIPPLNLDRQQIKQALINLVENAIGAIKDEGVVSFVVSHDPILKRIRLEAADTGSGISNEVKTRLFEPNFSTKKSGMGLGLTIVSTIIADHNGVISVQDNVPRGAKFVIELPVWIGKGHRVFADTGHLAEYLMSMRYTLCAMHSENRAFGSK